MQPQNDAAVIHLSDSTDTDDIHNGTKTTFRVSDANSTGNLSGLSKNEVRLLALSRVSLHASSGMLLAVVGQTGNPTMLLKQISPNGLKFC